MTKKGLEIYTCIQSHHSAMFAVLNSGHLRYSKNCNFIKIFIIKEAYIKWIAGLLGKINNEK